MSILDQNILINGKNENDIILTINHTIFLVNQQIAEANRLLKKYQGDYVDYMGYQLNDTFAIEAERDAWCKEVDAMFAEIFNHQKSSVQASFDLEKGDNSLSEFSGVYDCIKKKQNILDEFRQALKQLQIRYEKPNQMHIIE
ncbi:MAG: hypothetical protein IJP52_00435 [Paludibacteraceae bacterium]|nr:hypothetical protein [Paludibacteraceae bacterium]